MIKLFARCQVFLLTIMTTTVASKAAPSVVERKTSLGNVTIELNPEKSRITVANFLGYVEDQFYSQTIYHRVIPNFMAQGGGFDTDGNQKTTKAPIKLEADNGLENDRGSIAMARTAVLDSATSQFFINVVDNDFLNTNYAVFGKVTEGMPVVDAIVNADRDIQDKPLENVIIYSIEIKDSSGDNQPPTVRIKPAKKVKLSVGDKKRFKINARDSDGTITRVKYFINGKRVGVDSKRPFRFKFKAKEKGRYRLYAIAYDDKNGKTKSEKVIINVAP